MSLCVVVFRRPQEELEQSGKVPNADPETGTLPGERRLRGPCY